eukprot:291627-Chlamydomonas_euryale.AAC.1
MVQLSEQCSFWHTATVGRCSCWQGAAVSTMTRCPQIRQASLLSCAWGRWRGAWGLGVECLGPNIVSPRMVPHAPGVTVGHV